MLLSTRLYFLRRLNSLFDSSWMCQDFAKTPLALTLAERGIASWDSGRKKPPPISIYPTNLFGIFDRTNTDSDPDPEESCEEVPVNTHIHNRLGKLEKAYAALCSKVDAGFNQINDRFDKFDQRLDKVDSKVDGWVKWGVRVSLGLIVVGFGAMFESRDHLDKKIGKNQQEMRNFITESIKESEARLESNLTLAFVREVHQEVRCEVQTLWV
ncbi:hypothetical protein L211DRAFT_845224 [Terfezia boudieri ATCC MYA-4762]|uniref:t-SNARE coiled-coil homology domain-containing protein n=1 Tax=Terfezia boudieri ATCC MYA-4762 TaxID=1051890 RepID=A0A3N4MAH5_9PEZI|nr:hypothetical protein L211DRAFT_845224 [Terfezia boudieri ATCC MYA-4762]